MNLFKIMQSIRAWAQAGKIDYPGAIKYLNDLGVQMDGIVKQALDNVFKKGKARDPDFGDTVVKMQIDEQGVPFNPKNPLKDYSKPKEWTDKSGQKWIQRGDDKPIMISEGIGIESPYGKMKFDADIKRKLEGKEGVENLFQNKSKTLADELAEGEGVETFETILPTQKVPKEVKFGKPDYERIAKIEGVDVEEIRGKSVKEIIEYLAAVRDKADGGRVGFNTGGWADDLTGQAAAIYQSMNLGGHSDATIQNTLKSLGYWDGDTGGGGVENIINTQQSIIPGAGGGGGGGPTGPDSYTQTWTSAGIPTAAQSTSFINDPASVDAFNQKIYDYMGTQMGAFGQVPELRNQYNKYSQEDFIAQNPEYFSQGNVPVERTGLMGMWDKTKDFFSGLKGSPKVRGTLGTRLANQPRIPLPASMASWSLSPFNEASRNYNPNFVDQLNFLEMQDGMIGRDPNSGLLKYGPESVLAGKNVISMFGTNDYEEALQNKIDWFENRIARGKKISWDNYKKALTEQQNAGILAAQRKEAEDKKKKLDELAKITGTTQTTGGDGPGSWGGHGSVEAYDKSMADTYARAVDRHRGTSSNTGGWSPGSGNQGTTPGAGLHADYRRGGLATMFTRRR